ncbi:MAG TPA: NAD(+) synthase [Polyangiaceae bacterium]|nr:NAD(+) synthase [Polyangiaceae bacterium]
MQLVKVAAATLNQTPLDWDGNQRRISELLTRARSEGVSVLCLPELCITGYGCEDAFLSPAVRATALAVLEALLPETRGLVACLGLPLSHQKGVFNVSALVADGKLRGFVAKRALAGDGIHYEPRWFKPWPAGARTTTSVLGSELPLGDVLFDCAGVRIGFEICEDAWMADRRGAELTGVDLILNPSASHFAFGKHEVRRRLVLEGSRAFGVTYLYANLLGNEAGRAIYDGDALIASDGALVAAARRFRFTEGELTTAIVDVELTRTRQGWRSCYTPSVSDAPYSRVVVPFELPKAAAAAPAPVAVSWEQGDHVKEEELARALGLGLFDYLRKSRSRGFVVSLSGGADSAAVASSCACMVGFALADLGMDGLKRVLDYVPGVAQARSGAEVVRALLTTVYQSTRHSSQVTRSAAHGVAEALGARHFELDVEQQVAGYVAMIEGALGRKLDFSTDDLALQNIQARARAPSVWLLANIAGALLLSTSNRSEAAVGYATMDGDTAGGLSPIAGVDKAYLRRWLVWLEQHGPEGLSPIAALSAVNAQAPTAELRPASENQTDEGDLMPYDLLDAIERAAIRDKRSPLEVFELMRASFPQHATPALVTWIERFFRLFTRNQWKRERYAPSFHLDDENLDPKTWCRFPILSGGFERELAELRNKVLPW